MRILFMGTPEFAIPSIKKLQEEHEIVGVVTKVDKPNKRGNKIKFNPVKTYALENNLKVLQPSSVKVSETLDEIRDLNPDLIVVVAYGKILPQELIDIPKYGTINVHSSLLPKYRGAAPIHAAIINGEEETGVTIMDIVLELDAGDMILKGTTPIYKEDNLESLHNRLMEIGADTLVEAVRKIEDGSAVRTPQDHSKATFVKPFKKEDTKVDWTMGKKEIFNMIRGMDPFPGAFTTLNDKIVKLYRVEEVEKEYSGEVGEVVENIKGLGPVVKVSDGALAIVDGKPENKKRMKGVDLINGNYIKVGDVFK